MGPGDFSLEHMPYEAPILGYGILVLLFVFLTLNYLTFKLIGFILRVDTRTGDDPSKIVYLLSFIVSSVLTFVIIYPLLKKNIL
jgi:hypothetical protein